MGIMAALAWADFSTVVKAITDNFTTTNLLGILTGLVGITIPFTLIYRFAGRIKNTIIGAMTNSKRRR